MKVVATSDLHGQLPAIPPCDLLLIAGDICPVWDHKVLFQRQWLANNFKTWLLRAPARKIIGVWGNHDLIAEKAPHLLPELPWTVLTDQLCEFEGLRIYGLPWQRRFYNWAFNLDPPELDEKYRAIPPCDIIVSHGPPFGLGDYVERDHERTGSHAFLAKIDELRPKLVVFGHIHEGAGRYDWQHGRGTTIANVSFINEQYRPAHKPHEFEI
jgi:Icc-related predicted phosphoesterase